ncbi:MAG: hypothetical protein Q9227_009007 [Pyrenula ochraceoflavens]
MGLLSTILDTFDTLISTQPTWILCLAFAGFSITSIVLYSVLDQMLFRMRNRNEPPLVFHWFPGIGSTISYGMDPFVFFSACREKYGDTFTFILLGKKTTVCLGLKGNETILNAKQSQVNAEEVYTPLTTPVFGKDVVYDCNNAKLMEQKKFVKFGLTTEAFRSYVQLIVKEVDDFVARAPAFQGQKGSCSICPAMAEITLYTASRSLQGKEVREKFDSTFAELYHHLDQGFAPINFMLPWAPLPHNRKRDFAQKKMAETYMEIIRERKRAENSEKVREHDMTGNLMSSVYKDGTPVPDHEVAHMMIALLMAGQHSSSSTSSWIMLRLATRPDIQEDLLEEQKRVLGEDLPPLTYENLQQLPLNAQVVKETLRLHAPIHSVIRKVKSPLTVATPTKSYTIPTSHNVLSAPGVTARMAEYFPDPMLWEPHRWDEGHSLAYNGPAISEKEEQIDYGYGLVSKGASSPYLPFGAGRHRCIGEQFAYVQLGAITATMVRKLKVRNPPNRKGIPATDYSSLFSRPYGHAFVEWEKRQGTTEKV